MEKKTVRIVIAAFILVNLVLLVNRIHQENPVKQGEVKIKGLQSPVQIITDDYGIPHIYAQNKPDAWRALGFITAQDRLFQMDILRRIGNGQLSEILGEKTLKIDRLMRTLLLRFSAEKYLRRNANRMKLEMIQLAYSYFEGVNQFIAQDQLPLEFSILGYRPKRFTMAEAMAISGYMALSFAEGIIGDALFTELADELPEDMLNQLRIGNASDTQQFTQNTTRIKIGPQFYQNISEAIQLLEEDGQLFHGSNGWTLSPKRTKGGKAILANDPHIAIGNPSIFYEAHIHTPKFELYAHTIPGTPFPVIGHNQEMAWSVTMSEHDDLDLYKEKIDWKNKKYLFKGQWLPLKEIKQWIKIRGQNPKPHTIYQTEHGPLISKSFDHLNTDDLAIKWSYHHPKNNTFRTFYELMHARHVFQLREALSHAAAPGLNIGFADSKGNIANWVMGKIPRRDGFASDMVLDGSSGEHEYRGYYKITDNPHQVNPPSGILVTANYKSPLKKYDSIDGYYQPAGRYYRLKSLLESKEKWDLEELKSIQVDSVSPIGQKIVQTLISQLDAAQIKQPIYNALKQWQGECDTESIACTFFHQWSHEILVYSVGSRIALDRYKHFARIADHWHFYKWLILENDEHWWDQKETQEIESRRQGINKTFLSTLKKLQEKLGSEQNEWKWGRVHTVEFQNPLGKIWPLSKLFNLGPYPVAGGNFQINNLGTRRHTDNFTVRIGPATRRLIDFKDPKTSFGIIPTGNSGRIKSPHYSNQIKLYQKGQYRKQLMLEKEKIQGQTLWFKPPQ